MTGPDGTYRVLVTGSRAWDNGLAVWEALESIQYYPRTLVVVHGGARGADDMASRWARVHGACGGIADEPHEADWEGPCHPSCRPGHRRTRRDGTEFCPAAGAYRNAEMVALGADLCLAFIRDGSRGATHCAGLAEKAGIPTRRFTH